MDGREARNLEALHNNEDVMGISLISMKRQLHHTTSKQSERPGNEVFKEKLIDFYGTDIVEAIEQSALWTRSIDSMLTGLVLSPKDATVAHLIGYAGYAMRFYAPKLLGKEDLDSPRNGLLLLKPIEDAFDDSRVFYLMMFCQTSCSGC